MKKLCSIALIFVMVAALFAGCGRDDSTNPTGVTPDTSSTRPTVMPSPEIPMPSGTNTTSPSRPSAPGSTSLPGGSSAPGGTEMPNRTARPSARGPRY